MSQSHLIEQPSTNAASGGRSIIRVASGIPTSDGAGVKLTRVIGTRAIPRVDPFLMLDEFRSDEPKDYLAGFPSHPHRGFETFTYMLAGRFRHEDNHGGRGSLGAGGGQWMTAGRGIVHSEMPEQVEGLVWGFQLWINLPAKDKMCDPGYRDVSPSDIPTVALPGGASARVVAGVVGDAKGPIGDRATEPFFVDVTLPEGSETTLPIPATHAGFVYPFEGEVVAGDRGGERVLVRGELGELGAGAHLRLTAKRGSARVLVVAGKPLGEPIVQYGPFVMNTTREIEEAISDYQAGKF